MKRFPHHSVKVLPCASRGASEDPWTETYLAASAVAVDAARLSPGPVEHRGQGVGAAQEQEPDSVPARLGEGQQPEGPAAGGVVELVRGWGWELIDGYPGPGSGPGCWQTRTARKGSVSPARSCSHYSLVAHQAHRPQTMVADQVGIHGAHSATASARRIR